MNNIINTLNLTLTDRCNLNCKHCGNYTSIPKEEIDLDLYKSIISQADKMGCKHVIISGGEPFLRSDVFDIISFCEKLRIQCSILTNGTLLDDDKINKLSKFNNINQIRLSVDFSDRYKFEDFRGLKNIKDTVTKTLMNLRKNNIVVGINMTIMPENLDDVVEVAKFANMYGANLFRAVPLVPIGKSSSINLDREFYIDSIKSIIDSNIEIQKYYHYNKIKPNQINQFKDRLITSCPGGKSIFTFTSDGFIKKCPICSTPKNIHKVGKSNLEELINNLKENEKYNTNLQECNNCNQKHDCKGGCHAYTENLDKNAIKEHPFCIRNLWDEATDKIKNKDKILKYINDIDYYKSIMLGKSDTICFRSLPIWHIYLDGVFKFSG